MRKSGQQIHLAEAAQCTGCAACASICPVGAIRMVEDREGFLSPKIDRKTCIGCHQCEKRCPILNPESRDDKYETKAFAMVNKDEEIRRKSSSGGVFYALAKWTIDQGGVVFGARFDEKWQVVHDYAETLEGVIPFMGSKYVQSRIGDSYKQVKSFLEEGRWVLYSGTPCQLAGLRSFLGKKYERLLQVDLICYGVPSPGVWRSYLKERSKVNGEITRVSFRDKRDGWKHSRFIVAYRNGKEDVDGMFMSGFSYKVYLRRSCFDCPFRCYHRDTDLTIADYWGCDKHCREMDDDKGTSVVFSHSPVGDSILEAISESVCFMAQPKSKVIEYNPYMEGKLSITDKRGRFFRLYCLTSSFTKSSFVITKDDFGTRVVRKIKKLFAIVFHQS